MTYIPDLTEIDRVRRVGYLERGHPYTKGATSKAFFDRLVELVAHPIIKYFGYYTCDLGRCGRGPGLSRLSERFGYYGRTLTCGDSEVLVPGDNVAYWAPSLILHYIRCHGYAPPPHFIENVLSCPKLCSREYFTAITTAAPAMIDLVGEVLPVDESFTVEFPEHLPSSKVQTWTYVWREAGVLVEHKSERAFRILCSTTAQLRFVLLLWSRASADVCRTTTTSGDIEALFNKYRPFWTATGKSNKLLDYARWAAINPDSTGPMSANACFRQR
jgi:hypothetical protein